MIRGLREWLRDWARYCRCLTGDHNWVSLATDDGPTYTFCLHCGKRDA